MDLPTSLCLPVRPWYIKLMKAQYDFSRVVEEMGGSMKHCRGRELTRMRVRIRDGFKCRKCKLVRTILEVRSHNDVLPGLKGRIKLHDVHHLNGACGKNSRGYDKTNNLRGLITLCHKCHYKHHQFSERGKASLKKPK